MFGAGTATCGYWLQHTGKDDVNHVILVAWIEGFLTANNQQRATPTHHSSDLRQMRVAEARGLVSTAKGTRSKTCIVLPGH